MTRSLSAAFHVGKATFNHINLVHDYAGFIAMRLMFDGRFVDIDESRFKHPHAVKAAQIYNRANDLLQEKVVSVLSDMYAHGNVGPKPDFKKPAMSLAGNLAGMMMGNISKMTIGQAAILTLGTGVMIVAAHVTGQGAGIIPDASSSYLASKPSSAAEPKLG